MIIPSRYVVAIVSVLVFLLAGQASVQGYVLCLGEDGHAALEYAENTRCGTKGQDCHEGTPDLPLQEEHCGSCLDVPTLQDATSRRSQDHKDFSVQTWSPAMVQAFPAPTFLRTFTAHLYSQPPPRISQSILAHRTIVLLN